MHSYTTTVVSKKNLTEHVILISLAIPEGFSFESGQFIQLIIPHDEKIVLRSYSICSTPSDPAIALCVEIIPNGIGSTLIKNIHIGDDIQFKGPQGRFVCTEGDTPLLFVATGSGIAPIMSQIRHQLEVCKSTRPMHLLFGLRHTTDLFWQTEFQTLHDTYENFHFDMTLSQPDDTWTGRHGRVTAHLPDLLPDTHAFLCGSPAMVQEVRKMLIEKGLDAKKIHFEIF